MCVYIHIHAVSYLQLVDVTMGEMIIVGNKVSHIFHFPSVIYYNSATYTEDPASVAGSTLGIDPDMDDVR